ncbi:MAG: APC family permease [Ilumatobacteraceae bacterium]
MSGHEERFVRSMGLVQTTASGVAIIIGAGIFVLLGPAAEKAGGQVWISFLAAAALCALTAFSYMELSSMFPRAGSEHEFARQIMPEAPSFAVGWSMASALVVASATVALGFARYLDEFVDVDNRAVGVAVVALAAWVSSRGMADASKVVVALAAVQVAGLLVVVVLGAPRIGDNSLVDGPGVGGVVSGAALVFFAFIGFDEVITLSEETRDPRRTIPRALFLALTISAVVYAAVAIVSVSVLGSDRLARSTRPIADVATEAAGDGMGRVITSLALVSTFSTAILALTAGARMVYSLAGTGLLPARFAEVRDERTPFVALCAVSLAGLALVIVGNLTTLAEATDALVFLMFLVTNLVVIVLRIRRRDVDRPFRIPGAVASVPVLPVLGFVVTLLLAGRLHLDSLTVAAAIVAAGYVVGLVGSRRR